MIEQYLIKRMLENRDAYEEITSSVDFDRFGSEGRVLHTAIKSFYQETDADSGEGFEAWLKATVWHDKVKDILEEAKQVDSEDGVYKSIIRRYRLMAAAADIITEADDILNGKAYEEALTTITSIAEDVLNDTATTETPSFQHVINSTVCEEGMHWRLSCLNKSLGPVRKGDFIIVAARVETGKTTLLASEITYMAEQSGQPVLWINNEESKHKVLLRLWQAFLGVSKDWIIANQPEAEKRLADYMNKLIVAEPTFTWEVEQLIRKHKPCIVVFDVLDKLQGFKGDREDIMFGKLYRWARVLAREYCPVISVSQCDGTAEGKKWLNLSQLEGSRTAKQKEADAIIMIGKDEQEYMRYISIPKNKLIGDANSQENLRHGKFEVMIDPVRARYEDL